MNMSPLNYRNRMLQFFYPTAICVLPLLKSPSLREATTTSKLTTYQGTVAQCVALLPHSKKVVGSSPASCNMSGLVPGPFCVEVACSPRVHLGSPHRTPQQQKHAKKNRCSSVLSLTKTRQDWALGHPGRCIVGCPLLLAFPGGGRQNGIKAEDSFHRLHLTACVCVCCVSPLTLCV